MKPTINYLSHSLTEKNITKIFLKKLKTICDWYIDYDYNTYDEKSDPDTPPIFCNSWDYLKLHDQNDFLINRDHFNKLFHLIREAEINQIPIFILRPNDYIWILFMYDSIDLLKNKMKEVGIKDRILNKINLAF